MPDPIHNRKCFASHMGTWMIEPGYARQALAAIRADLWKPKALQVPGIVLARTGAPQAAAKKVIDPESDPDYPEILYTVDDRGIAVVSIQGAMAKAKGKYASAGTVQIRRALRAAVVDPDVEAIMLFIDSPGGTASGTQSLADDVRAADAIKPVYTHVEDMMASAGYWAGSQARRITANRSALVGSLGIYAVIEDTSKQAEAAGVEVHVISTGPHKGAFVDGAPVTDDQLAEAARTVNDLNALFMQAVAGGRRKSLEQTQALFDGRVHIAATAKDLGLIDEVCSFDQAMDKLAELVASSQPPPDRARRLALARAKA